MSIFNKIRNTDSSGSVILKITTIFLAILTVVVIAYGVIRDREIVKKSIALAKASESVKTNAANTSISTDKEIASSNTQIIEHYNWQGKKWYVIGDNITLTEKYQKNISELLKCEYITDAANKQKLGTMADKMTLDILSKVDLVTVFGGMYDYGYSKPLGTIKDDGTIDTFYGNIKKVITKIKTIKPDVKLVFITPYERGAARENLAGAKYEQYVKALQEVCDMYKVPVIDLYSKSGIDKSNYRQYLYDGIIPNDQGYSKIEKVISDFLESM